jgi:hypothetical protein
MAKKSLPSALKQIVIPIAVSLIFFAVIMQLDGKFRNPYFHDRHTKRSAGVIVRGIPIPFFLEKESCRTFTPEERQAIETDYKKPKYINNILNNKHWYKNTGLRSVLSTIAWISFIIGAIGLWETVNSIFRTHLK